MTEKVVNAWHALVKDLLGFVNGFHMAGGGGREEQLQKKSQTRDLGYRDGEEIYIFCTPEFMA